MNKTFIVAVDGPAGSGKSTVAKNIAKELTFFYIDTGAMYRAITLKALRNKLDLEDEKALIRIAKSAKICLSKTRNGKQKVFLDDKDVTRQIRTPRLTNSVSYIARVSGVRKHMVKLQRQLGRSKNSVLEGRDIGTVVFPGAAIKFYLDASAKERAKRRFKELKTAGSKVKLSEIKKNIEIRDKKDKTRKHAPLKKAKDAICVDTTNLTIKQVTDKLLKYIRKVY